MLIFNRHLSIELINGCGVFLEIADSRAVWTVDKTDGRGRGFTFHGRNAILTVHINHIWTSI